MKISILSKIGTSKINARKKVAVKFFSLFFPFWRMWKMLQIKFSGPLTSFFKAKQESFSPSSLFAQWVASCKSYSWVLPVERSNVTKNSVSCTHTYTYTLWPYKCSPKVVHKLLISVTFHKTFKQITSMANTPHPHQVRCLHSNSFDFHKCTQVAGQIERETHTHKHTH